MTNEYYIGYTACLGMLGLTIGCLFYMLGGRHGKWQRRFIASFIIAATLNGCALLMRNWHWGLILTYPALTLGFSMGYGGITLEMKIRRRVLFCVMVLLAGLVCAIVYGGDAWWILASHVFIAIASVYLGVISKVQAAAEEVFVCAVLNLGLMMYPFINMI